MSIKNQLHLSFSRIRFNTIVILFLGILGYFLFNEHLAPTVQALPYLLILGCIVICIYILCSDSVTEGEGMDDGLKSDGGSHER